MHIKVYIKRSDGNIEEQMDNRIVIKKKIRKRNKWKTESQRGRELYYVIF